VTPIVIWKRADVLSQATEFHARVMPSLAIIDLTAF
jgi:hypothetical protein